MYRAVALDALRKGIDWSDEEKVVRLMSEIELELDKPKESEDDGRLVTVVLGGEDVSNEIRTAQLGEGASVVSTYGGVREVLVVMQQNIARGESVVMEGRDIGVRVLPEAQMKIFLTGSVEERARRKWQYFMDRGEEMGLERVRKEMVKRDKREETREIDPLKPLRESWVLDTTGMGINEVVRVIVEKLEKTKLIG